MKKIPLFALAAAALVGQVGCSPIGAARRAFTELRGARGKVFTIAAAPDEFHQGLSGIRIGRVSNTIEPVCRSETKQAIEAALTTVAEEMSAELDGEKGDCTVDVDINFYKGPGGVGALIGKGALLVGRARVHDRNPEQVADFIVVVASEAVRTTEEELAGVFARVLLEHVRDPGDADRPDQEAPGEQDVS